jgi:hypothetical protein
VTNDDGECEVDPIDVMRAELDAIRVVIDTLAPLKPVERLRVLAAAAAHFGFYEVAIEALKAAGRL